MSELSRFQAAFTAALAGDGAALDHWLAPGGEAGLLVYRNTVLKGAIDALQASFPTVERLVGETWFRAAAREFVLAHPPGRPALLAYGAAFPAWLAGFPPAAAMPYLGRVAHLDRLWSEAHLAADAAPLDPAALGRLGAAALARTRAVPHPSLRLAWFDDNSASLWLATRPPAVPPESFELAPTPEGLLLARPGAEVTAGRLDQPAFAFLHACVAGRPLTEAAACAMEAGPADLDTIVAAALEQGLFVRLEPIEGNSP